MSLLKEKSKFYTPHRIVSTGADYCMIIGERSNGKTTGCLAYALEKHVESGYLDQLAIVRRWDDDFKGKNSERMLSGLVDLGFVKKYTNNKFNSIYYHASRWFLCVVDEYGKRTFTQEQPFAYGFAISLQERYKSTSYSNIRYILFDEFITRNYYIPDEFIQFTNLLSTLIRLRDDVIIFMCGNTVNKYCPYFQEMGLTNIKKMKKGDLDVYKYGESDLTVAVEFSDFPSKSKKSNKYFAFDNPKLQMITSGTWEIDLYPHLPVKYNRCDIIYWYYIEFDEQVLQCEVIDSKEAGYVFTYIHRKTTPIKSDTLQLVFTKKQMLPYNYRTRINKPFDDIGKKVWHFFKNSKVFYQDNEVGEVVRNYLIWCNSDEKVIKNGF